MRPGTIQSLNPNSRKKRGVYLIPEAVTLCECAVRAQGERERGGGGTFSSLPSSSVSVLTGIPDKNRKIKSEGIERSKKGKKGGSEQAGRGERGGGKARERGEGEIGRESEGGGMIYRKKPLNLRIVTMRG